MKIKAAASAALLASLLTSLGWGFTFIDNSSTGLPIKWPPGTVVFRLGLGTSPTLSDGSVYNSSAQAALDVWNAQLGSIQLQGQTGATGAAGNGNDVNEIAFASNVFGTAFEANVLAVTTTWSLGNERTEADVIFNSARAWDSYRGGVRSSAVDLRRVAIHEIGHALGLDHPDEAGQSRTAIMNSHVGNLDTLAFDDIEGAQRLYGPPGFPINDHFASASTITLTSGSTEVTGFNTNASKQSGEPLHANNAGGRSVWWRWTAPTGGSVSLSTQGSVFDTTLGVYTGAAVNALTTVAFDDDIQDGVIQYSTVSFTATAGTMYSFSVDGFDGDSGAIELTLSFEPSQPVITTQPASQSVTAGASVTLSVTATGGALTYQWSRNGDVIPGATNSTLTLDGIQPSQAGVYGVTVSNASGSTVSLAAVIVVLEPVTDHAVTAGRSITFFAGTGAAFQWQISTDGGTSWSNLSDDAIYSGSQSATLTIANAAASLDGARFRATSTLGGVTTPGMSFTLTVSPAFFPNPAGLVVDLSGNLLVADASLNALQKISPAGVVSAFAGTSGQAGSTDATGSAARFNQPSALALNAAILFAADTANATLRRIATDGAVTTFAGSPSARGNTDATGSAATFAAPAGLAFDSTGNLFVADETNHTIRRITSAGAVTTFAGAAATSGTTNSTPLAARFNRPRGLAFDASGNLFVADSFNHTIRKIPATGPVSTWAGLEGVAGATDGSGSVALFNNPTGLAIDSAGNLYVADTANSTIRKITPAGAVSTFAGLPTISGLKDGIGGNAWFNHPQALAFDAAGNLFVADTGNAAIRKITPAGAVTTLALTDGTPTTPNNPPPPSTPAPSGGGGGGGGGGSSSLLFLTALTALACLRKVEQALRAR